MSVRLWRFMECSGVLPTTQFAYKKGIGTCDALLCVARALQSALEMGQEDRMVQIDFSVAFDIANHQGILFKLICGSWRFCTVYSESFSLIADNVSLLMGVGVNWWPWCQECLVGVFWFGNYCSSCTPGRFFLYSTKQALRLCCCAIPR